MSENIEQAINGIIKEKLENGIVEEIVAKRFEESINSAVDKLFGKYGDVTETIEKKIKEVMIPYLESYDYSNYIVKLDSVLTEILNETTLDNKKILSNFKNLITQHQIKRINLSEIFDKWCKHVSKNVDVDKLERYDDEYGPITVSISIEDHKGREWSSYDRKTIYFECPLDECLNFEFEVQKFKHSQKQEWNICNLDRLTVSSLKWLSEVEIFISVLRQNMTSINMDIEDDEIEIKIDKERI